jgi:predicted metal-dependent hydrolase
MVEREVSPTTCEIQYGLDSIVFSLRFCKRKSLAISVNPDLSVSVDAPEDSSIDDIIARVNRRAAWIIRQRTFFEGRKETPQLYRYVGGETHLYLGRQYRLKLVESDSEFVKLTHGYFVVHIKSTKNTEKIKKILDQWYLDHSRKALTRRLSSCYELVKKFGISYPQSMNFRKMNKRWGSCSKDGNIMLNTELARASVYCIDYVIVHELCHMQCQFHNEKFYNLLKTCMPDWKRRKEVLERKF